jgi:regulatory protein
MNNEVSAKAMDKAMMLLGRRAHSTAELRTKLRQREFSWQVVNNTIAECERLKLLDDREFASLYASELRQRGYGPFRIRNGLMKKGISREIIDSLLDATETPGAELERAVASIKGKLRTFQREPDLRKRRDKAYRFLAGRGFSSSIISEAIDKYGEEFRN